MKADAHIDEISAGDPTYDEYRAMCAAAVTSLFFGLLSVLSFLSPYLFLLPILGIIMGLFALAQIRQRPRELAGRRIAVAGISLSSLLLAASMATAVYVYMTEVPEGYQRVSYAQLQTEEGQVGQLVPPLATDLDGQQVFIKGYVFPGTQRRGIKTFLLVRDKGDCCFGGNPKVTDRVQVTLADPNRLTFSSGLHKVAGKFRVDTAPARAVDADGRVFYYLDDCVLR